MTRTVLSISGTDRIEFLQGLITNDMARAEDGIIYAALLTPQGKYIADFFVIGRADDILIDVASSHAAQLFQRLSMYRLRADVQITETDLIASRGTGSPPMGSFSDPRHEALGWRAYGATDVSQPADWDAINVEHVIPAAGVELTPDSYILEHNFEALNGVDFRKGCFVGQEIVARMKHKTTLKKGLVRVALDVPAKAGALITSHDKPAGVLHTVSGLNALAYLRFDRSTEMKIGAADVRLRQ